MRAEDRRRQEGRRAGMALRGGLWASGALMAAGLLLAILRPVSLPPGPPDWAFVLRQAAAMNGEALALLGIAALIATPFLRVVFVAAAFARGRQWRLLAAALCVLGLLAAGVALGRR